MKEIDEKNILKTYQFNDVTLGEVFPYTERKTLYGHLKVGDTVLIERYDNAYQKKKGNYFERIKGIVKRVTKPNALERNRIKNNRSLEMLIEATEIV